MKLTKTELKQIIKEEIGKVLKELGPVGHFAKTGKLQQSQGDIALEKKCEQKIDLLVAFGEHSRGIGVGGGASSDPGYHEYAMRSAQASYEEIVKELESGPCKGAYDKYLQQKEG